MTNWQGFMQRYCGKQAVMALFLLCALPVTILTALLTPPGQAPDEVAHYARAVGLLDGVVFVERHPGVGPLTGKMEEVLGTKVDAGFVLAAVDRTTQIDNRPVETLDDRNWMEVHPRTHTLFLSFVALKNTLTYFPAAYVPAALGVAVASHIFGATPLHCFITARIFMAVAFLLAGLAALRIAAFGAAMLVSVLLLPMTLFLGGTLNQDGLLIALTCLAAACLTRGTRPWRAAGLVVFAIVLGAKLPYILLMSVFTLPLLAPGFWRRLFDMALASLPVVVWGALIVLFAAVPDEKPQYFPGPLYHGDHSVAMYLANPSMQMHILLARPRLFLSLPYYLTIGSAHDLFISMIGVLGLLQIFLAPWVYNAWAFCVVFSALGLLLTRRPQVAPPRAALINFIAVVGIVAATYWLILIISYLFWTDVGSPFIVGIQGRYLIIFLPFALFAIPHLQSLPGLRRVSFSLPPLLLALPSLGMGVFDIGYIPLKLVLNYYLH